MNKYQILTCPGALTLLLLLTLAASAQERGFYAKGDLGVALTKDVQVKNYLGLSNPGKLELDPGIRFDAGVGYNVCRWFAGEFEAGVIHNRIEHQNSSRLWSWPLMVNAVVNVPVSQKFVPFVGLGGGGVVSTFQADDFSLARNTVVDGSGADLVWAWQGFAGIRYNLNEKFDINLSYKYLATGDPSWDVDVRGSSFNQAIEFKGPKTHAILLGVSYRF